MISVGLPHSQVPAARPPLGAVVAESCRGLGGIRSGAAGRRPRV